MSSLSEIEAVLEKIRQEKYPRLRKDLVQAILSAEASLPEHPAEAMSRIRDAVERYLSEGID